MEARQVLWRRDTWNRNQAHSFVGLLELPLCWLPNKQTGSSFPAEESGSVDHVADGKKA